MTPGLAARGRHCRPSWYQRALTRFRTARRSRQVEAARDDAYIVRIEAHVPPPTARPQAALAALYGVLHHEHGLTASVPPAAVLPDEDDGRWPHLAPAYTDDTCAFGLSIVEAGQ